ncbi:methyl-accepting chemotaxis protein [Rhizobium sp. VS19-DR104.2]|uniref:methyl-accepting chemotaxis protein n=1 Tax=unclassified Rhizobium TaxID=2613769 RepID=UPI001CC65675|nr:MULTISPECIES: methyl-accepting chemotaxis protein [unclassified Rhizobium]MBZ5762403.1 methyl-accepting chemotaxis protein [Rhizobium sp. VS19-DR96]MBZ5768446.1 methyl-accepting chemotaxis protein [Rhizobium sp. VS19-DR129.2]MBZ5776100.1 methyl-accepting chemotaxis protein [Rhizobium sp. VS19-DRK62.2]MBZ5786209.1 methyl-accepting chemotaxis protein [Rhizobium sp. VS19-DR121]MBZ5804481.1 methyl-accepting chemotaxis protein [Rhizobium sp. VS19-DR181]
MNTFDTRSYVRAHGPIVLFVVMTVLGAAIIWIGKLYDVDIRLVTFVPILLMLTYFAINMLPGVRVHNEQAGDNLYYMGFIFTLASLGISLYKFSGQASIEDIVKNFGIAIVTTISGISLRIFYNQTRRDPADIESAVRTELAEMTRRVRTELDSSAMEFSSYRRTSNQMLSEGFEEISRQAEKNGEAVRAAIEAMSLRATQTIQEASERLFATIEQTSKQMSDYSEKNARTVAEMAERVNGSVSDVANKADALARAIDVVVEKYAAAKSPDELLRIEVSPAIDSIRALAENTSAAIARNTADTRETAKKVLAAIAPFKQTSANLKSLVERLDTANSVGEISNGAINDLVSRIDETLVATRLSAETHTRSSERIDLLSESVKAGTAEVKAAGERTRAQAERIEQSLAEFNRAQQNGSVAVRSVSTDREVNTTDGARGAYVDVASIHSSAAPSSPSTEERTKRGWWNR